MIPEAKAAPSEPSRQPSAGWVLYDADCGICSRWVRAWEPTLDRYGLAIAPLQSSWVPERTGISQSEILSDILLLERNGELRSGPDVYRHLMRRIWWTYPLYLLSITPALRLAFDWAYRTFARHRTRISGSCGLPGVR